MNTIVLRSGFFFLFVAFATAFTSCEKQEEATATIEVLERYTATQGVVNRLRPVSGAKLRIYGTTIQGHEETILFTDSEGKVRYEYPYDAFLFVDVEFEGRSLLENNLQLKVGETVHTQIILPE